MAATITKSENSTAVLLTSAKNAQTLRKQLKRLGLFDCRRKVQRQDDGNFAIPCLNFGLATLIQNCGNLDCLELEENYNSVPLDRFLAQIHGKQFNLDGTTFTIDMCELLPSKKELVRSVREDLLVKLKLLLCDDKGFGDNEGILEECPRHWEKHGDLVLLPEGSFISPVWDKFKDDLLSLMTDVFKVKRIAKKSSISCDGYRTPQVQLLLGRDGWVEHVDNGIRYSYDITKCMFSAGNITEKLRLAQLDCRGETIVDLYAGIGYFTLPYLVHANAAMLHACEWNPNAVASLRHNLQVNGVYNRCVIHEGDNRKACPTNVSDRVNLGLIPSSTEGWPTACAALKRDSGGILHIHSNVTLKRKKNSHTCKCESSASSGSAVSAVGCVNERVVTNDRPENFKEMSSSSNCDSLEHPQEGSADNKKERNTVTISGVLSASVPGCVKTLNTRSVENSVVLSEIPHKTDKVRTTTSDKIDNSLANSVEENTIGTFSECGRDNSNIESKMKFWKEVVMGAQECLDSWAEKVSDIIKEIFFCLYSQDWTVMVLHIERVKSYAPHVYHVVVDLECRPY